MKTTARMNRIQQNKGAGLILFACFYIIAYIAGFLVGTLAEAFLWQMLLFDLTATVVIWAISLLLHNSSLYDAYWSLTPMVMAICAIIRYSGSLNAFHYVFLLAFFFWSVRLTGNWIVTFENLAWEDWRYRQYRELPKPLWHLANFFGIMLIPTLFVFAGMVPVFYYITLKATPLSLAGSAVVWLGTALEFFADRQMRRYTRSSAGRKTCRTGLWQYSRHPNYLGEILVWVGAYLALICSDASYWYLLGGVAVMIFLFTVISIPLAEKRQLLRRPDYAEYCRTTSMLLLLPHRKSGIADAKGG